MRLGVTAALVDGTLLPGDVELAGGVVTGLGLERRPSAAGIATPGFVDLQVNGFAGVDLQRADAEGFRHVGEALLRTRRHRLPADVRHGARGRSRRRAALAPRRGAGRPHPRRPSRGPVHRGDPAGRARSRRPARSRRRATRPAARRGPGAAGDARARAPRRRGADRGAARSRRDRLLRPLGGVRGGRGARLRRRREHGHAPLQRDAEAGRARRGGARAQRRHGPGDRRRPSRSCRPGAARVAQRRRAFRARERRGCSRRDGRRRVPPRLRARSRAGRRRAPARTACSPAAR